MTPEELEELRALAGRLSGTAYNENLAAILGAALEHIHKQDARIVELETQMDLLQNEIFELRKGTDSQKVISELMAQVAALQEIAEWERASRLRDQVDYETDDEMMPEFCRDAIRQLSEERPEAFR